MRPAGKPAHVLYDMDADLTLALQLSAAEAEAAERRATGVEGRMWNVTVAATESP